MPRNVRLLLTLLATCVLALALVAASNAAPENVYIKIFSDGDYTVGPGQRGVLRSGWSACSKGLDQDWLDAINIRATLSYNGEVVETIEEKQAAKAWTAPTMSGPDTTGYCLWPVTTMWRTTFLYDKLKLKSPGDYQLYVHAYLTEPVIDGGNYDGVGGPDYWVGSFSEANVQIHVTQ